MKRDATSELVSLAATFNGPGQSAARNEAIDSLASAAARRQAWLAKTGRTETKRGLRAFVRKNQATFTQLATLNTNAALVTAAES